MRIQIASDLHHETAGPGALREPLPPVDGAELLILAGDIHAGTSVVDLYGSYPVPVVYVHGNHEFYSNAYPDLLASLKESALGTSVLFLDCDACTVGDIRILGACMWTDYTLQEGRTDKAMETARTALTDYKAIRHGSGKRTLQPEDIVMYHREAAEWLERQLVTPFSGKTVVVTHHAPSIRSLPEVDRDHPLAPAYAADLERLIAMADIWVHGDVHTSADYSVGKCRVICNPRGRPGRNRKDPAVPYENAGFNPAMIVDL
jgi:predicted phosphohydrolase